MKLTIMLEIIILCIALTIFSIFTIDSVAVRKAELMSVLATDGQNIVTDYFEGSINAVELQQQFEIAIKDASHSKSSEVNISIFGASAMQGIVDILVEVTYIQPNGRPRLLSYKRVYIKETQSDPSAENPYSFIRTIDAEHYKTETNQFVSESNGGLREDSIWRTESYEMILDSVFSTAD